MPESPTATIDRLMVTTAFTDGVAKLAHSLGRSEEDVTADARACLLELATVQRRVATGVWARWAHFLWERAYELDVDHEGLERIRTAAASRPLVFLPSHKSNLDGYVMAALLHDEGFPPNHVLGGINMAFFPLGALGRRVGVIWIRRSFGGDEVYKFALRRYLAYLVSERRSLEWYIEGGRSRTGKLLPPKMGLLSYLARGVEEAGVEDVLLAPVSIVYDRLTEVHEMTDESRGAKKQAEGMGWLARYAWSQREHLGKIRVRFGEPLSLDAASGTDSSLGLSKTAFEVMTRMNRATPVTSAALATLAMLGADGWAVTLDQAIALVQPLRDYARRRNLPGRDITDELETRSGMARVLGELGKAEVVDSFTEGANPVYRISPDRELAAAFFRNMIIHWFVNRAIVELSLVAAAETDGASRATVALDEAFRLRDLLKFEFFFAEKDEYAEELRDELGLIAPAWELDDAASLENLAARLGDSGGLLADRVLRSFLEAYWVVADRLADHGSTMVEEGPFIEACLKVGRQYQLQRRIVSGEAISKELFGGAFKLAANRGLLDHDNPDRSRDRKAFAAELHEALRRLEVLNTWNRASQTRREGSRPTGERDRSGED